MKRLVVGTLLLLGACVPPGYVAPYAAPPPPLAGKYGFRDLVFETPIEKLDGFEQVGERLKGGRLSDYVRKTDSLKVGDADLSDIHYVFYKGRLFSVFMRSRGASNADLVMRALVSGYGHPDESRPHLNEYTWRGSRTRMEYDYSDITQELTVQIVSTPLFDEMMRDDEASAKGADL